MKIHILVDNRTKKCGFLAEHGLSLFIKHENVNILFDSGQSDVYFHNAALMGVDLNRTDSIVLSHGYYDHCGGLVYFPESDHCPKIYVHEAGFIRAFYVPEECRQHARCRWQRCLWGSGMLRQLDHLY